MAAGTNKSFKSTMESLIAKIMTGLASNYIRLKNPVLIVVVGSIGKTSTKMMIGQLLATEKRVNYMGESYNSGLGLAMSVFQQTVPQNLLNPLSWIWIFSKAIAKFFTKKPDIMVLEYGIAHPGDMKKHLKMAVPDIAVLTAVAPEHMEYMKTIEAVATEELAPVKAAKDQAFINRDDVEAKFLPSQKNLHFYGSDSNSSYSSTIKSLNNQGSRAVFNLNGRVTRELKLKIIAEHMIRQMAGAAGVAMQLGVSLNSIEERLESIEPVAGRMRLLAGLNSSVLIDDTANFSPTAGIAAIRTLKKLQANRRIIVFGNQHELGSYQERGFADVAKEFEGIDMFIFIGSLAKQYFVPAAKKLEHKLNQTIFIFDDAITAGKFLRDRLQPDDAVLLKGPFGGYYVEECTKQLLANTDDSKKLTRQSDFWIRKKAKHFGRAFYDAPKK